MRKWDLQNPAMRNVKLARLPQLNTELHNFHIIPVNIRLAHSSGKKVRDTRAKIAYKLVHGRDYEFLLYP
jgi:hypothetical protein